MLLHHLKPVWFLSFLLSTLYSLPSASHGIEGHTVPPLFTPVDSVFPLSFIPQVRPTGGGIPGYPKPKPYALLGLGSYSAEDRWTFGGRAEGRRSFLSGTARGLAVRNTDFGPASENDFSLRGGAAYRPTGQIAFEARFRGIESNDDLGDVRRTANAFASSVREADRKGYLTVQGSWTEIYLDAPEHATLRSFKLEREGERLVGLGTKQGQVREAWLIFQEQGGNIYPERLGGKVFLAGGLGFGNRMFLEAGIRAAGYAVRSRNEAFAYPYLSLSASHPKGFEAALAFEPSLDLPSFEERYLHDPYLLLNPVEGYARSPVRLVESASYTAASFSLEIRSAQERRVNLWVQTDIQPGFLSRVPFGEAWKYSGEAKGAVTLWRRLSESLEVSGYRANFEIPYEPRLKATNLLVLGSGTDTLRIRLDYVGERSRGRGESLRGYPLVAATLEKQVWPGIAASFAAENLGDNRYELIAGRFHRGRTLSLAMTCRI